MSSKSQAKDETSPWSSEKEEGAPGLSRSLSGSTFFGDETRNKEEINPHTLFMTSVEYGGKTYEIDPPASELPMILARANQESPLLIAHIAKGNGDKIVIKTQRNSGKPKKGTRKATTPKASKEPQILTQFNKDLEDERGEVIYAWMFIAEIKNSKYNYYLLLNKVKSRLEIGTKHFMLEKKYTQLMDHPPYRIYLTGEFRVTPGRLEYNFVSGTYMKPKIENLTATSRDIKHIEEMFDNALKEYFSGLIVVERTSDKSPFILSNPNVTDKEWEFLQRVIGAQYMKEDKRSNFMAKMQRESGATQQTIADLKEEQRRKQTERILAMMNQKKP